jgi:hypothetical protein
MNTPRSGARTEKATTSAQALQPCRRAHRGVGLPSLRPSAEALQYLVEGRPFGRVLREI